MGNIDKKSFITGIVANVIVNGIFLFLSWDKAMFYTGILSVVLFVVLILLTVLVKNIKFIIPTLILIILILISSYFIENKYINFEERVIYDEIVHLGDKEISWFDVAEPENNKYLITGFKLPEIPNKTIIEITAKDVDPDYRSGPVAVFVNKQFVSYLNNSKQFKDIPLEEEHSYGYASGKIEIPRGFLIKNKNEILIALIPTERGYDDILISEIKLLWK